MLELSGYSVSSINTFLIGCFHVYFLKQNLNQGKTFTKVKQDH